MSTWTEQRQLLLESTIPELEDLGKTMAGNLWENLMSFYKENSVSPKLTNPIALMFACADELEVLFFQKTGFDWQKHFVGFYQYIASKDGMPNEITTMALQYGILNKAHYLELKNLEEVLKNKLDSYPGDIKLEEVEKNVKRIITIKIAFMEKEKLEKDAEIGIKNAISKAKL